MRAIFLPVLLVLLIAGCGHKGNLYLPSPEPKPAAEAPVVQQPTSEEKKQ